MTQFQAEDPWYDAFTTGATVRMVTIPMCPDLLRYDYLGEADNMRGRVIRGFFWLMRVWKV